MAQQIINTGAAANDGTGDPLRTAFTETNDNFTEIYTAGPVGSNVQIANNTILTLNTNGNLVLAPNGTGRVVANVDVVPNRANVRNLGSATARWSTVYAQYLNVTNSTTVAGDLTVGGNLTVTGDIVQVGNIITDAKTIQLANTASTANAAAGSGITVGASDDIATLLYNSTGNVWTMNIGVSAVGNVTAPYFFGNGSQLTGLPVQYGNSNVVTLLAAYGNNTISTTGNITGGYLFGNGSQLTGLPESYGNANVTALLSNLGSNVISGTGNITTTGKVIAGNLNSSTLNNSGNISVVASSNTWTFGIDGNLTVPGNIQTISTGFPFSSNISGINTGSPTVMVTLTDAVFGAPEIGQVTISGVVGTTQANDTWYYASIDPSNFVLYNDAAATNPVNGNTWTAYISGGSAVSQGYSNISITGGNVSVATGTGDTWLFGANGNLTLPLGGQIIVSGGLISSGASPAPSINGFGSINSITVSASGNVTGAYVKGNGSELTNLPAPGVAQDITSVGDMSIMTYDGNLKYASYATVEPATGTIKSAGNVSATGNVIGGNIRTVGLISASGNITGNYILGNGSQLTGLPATYGNANVTTLLGNLGSNNISTTGNITAGNFIGNGAGLTNVTVSVAGNIVGTQPNVSLVAGSYTSTFDNTGNVSMPGNVFANGVNVRQIETIAVNSVAANAAYTGTTVANWTTSYTGSGGKIKIQAQISAFTSTSQGAYTWALQRNSANVATGRFYFNQPDLHMTMPTIAYIDSSGNTAPQTYSILLGNNMICDSGDTCLIMITEY